MHTCPTLCAKSSGQLQADVDAEVLAAHVDLDVFPRGHLFNQQLPERSKACDAQRYQHRLGDMKLRARCLTPLVV